MDNIDLREEFYGEVHNMKPSWWAVWGIFFVFGFILILFTLSYFIRYPDIIVAEARFASDLPSVTIPAKNSSQIAAIKKDSKEYVTKGDYIFILKDNSDYEDILHLKENLKSLELEFGLIPFFEKNLITEYKLGNQIQGSWNALNHHLLQYYQIVKQKKYELEIQRLKEELLLQQNILKKYQKLLLFDSSIAKIQDTNKSIDSVLLLEAVISKVQFSESLIRNMEIQKVVGQEELSIARSELEIARIRNNIEQLKQQQAEQLIELEVNIRKALIDLELAIKGWEDSYVIQAPISGQIHFLSPIRENQQVMVNEELVTIIPDSMTFSVLLKIPFSGAGKLEMGQAVNIKLNDYPYNEYGVLKGELIEISGVASQSHYLGKVALEGNRTSYNKLINIKENTLGIAEIITEDRSWLGRLLEKVIYVFRR